MARVVFHTNLDLHGEEWPELGGIDLPRVGDTVLSNTVWANGFRLKLKVVAVCWKKPTSELYIHTHGPAVYVAVELGMCGHIFLDSFTEFYDTMRRGAPSNKDAISE